MAINNLVILHDVFDAKHWVDNKFNKNSILLSTHPNVDMYLKEHYNLECKCLSSYISSPEILKLLDSAIKAGLPILEALDKEISPYINAKHKLTMNYFVPLYSYLGLLEFYVYQCLFQTISRAIKDNNPTKLIYYDFSFNSLLDGDNTFTDFIHLCFSHLPVEAMKSHKDSNNQKTKFGKLKTLLDKAKRKPLRILSKIGDNAYEFFKYNIFLENRQTILFFAPLYDLEFLVPNSPVFNKFNIIYYENDKCKPKYFLNKLSVNKISIDCLNFDFLNTTDNPFVKLLLKNIKNDFIRNIGSYMDNIVFLKGLIKRHPISLAIWGNPPTNRSKALFFEFLRSINVKILGCQHGSNYLEVVEPWLFKTDLSRCDYFISYGPTQDDLKRKNPDITTKVKILPLGSARIKFFKKQKKEIDILFPLATMYPFFSAGMKRLPLHQLHDRQLRILNYLSSLQDLNIYIKPEPNSIYNYCSVLSILGKNKKWKVIDNLTLMEFLEEYKPRITIIECYSTPLFEVLPVDSEIFVMNDEIYPIEAEALRSLKKRVNYSENLEEFIAMIDNFLAGNIEKKRDDSFFRKYVYKDNAKEQIVKMIENLTQGKAEVI